MRDILWGHVRETCCNSLDHECTEISLVVVRFYTQNVSVDPITRIFVTQRKALEHTGIDSVKRQLKVIEYSKC